MNRFIIAEPKLCIGCKTCMAVCSKTHIEQGLQGHPRLTVVRSLETTAPVSCRHCEDAPCAKVCPVQAITVNHNSIDLDESLCIGCKLCAIVCPFGAIEPSGSEPLAMPSTFPQSIADEELTDHPESLLELNSMLTWKPGLKAVAVKCDLCQFSEQGPECVRACPNHAITLVDDDLIESVVAAKRQDASTCFTQDFPLLSESSCDIEKEPS